MPEDIHFIYAKSGKVRSRIQLLPPHTYWVDVERLVEATDAGGYKRGEFWSVIEGLSSITDSEECAKELAAENLKCGTAE